MKNSIETIWKDGFLNETSLVAPKINDLYNRKSQHVVEKMKRTFRVNVIVIISMSVVMPVLYYFLDVLWLGLASSVLMLLTGWYGKIQMAGLKTLDPGATSLDYLKSFDRWLKDVFLRSEKIARIYYTLCFVIAITTIGLTWSKNEELVVKTNRAFPDLLLVGNIPLVAIIMAAVATCLMFYYSKRFYRWDVRLMYGCVLNKLDETIAEMEKLREGQE